MSRYDRREWQRPDPPHPERERPVKKRGGRKPWKLEYRWKEPPSWAQERGWPNLESWGMYSRYATEARAREGLRGASKGWMSDKYEFRIVGPADAIHELTEP